MSLVILLVKLFSHSVEQVNDEDDEEDSRKNSDQAKIKTYLESPLLLEQQEARIFSIIR